MYDSVRRVVTTCWGPRQDFGRRDLLSDWQSSLAPRPITRSKHWAHPIFETQPRAIFFGNCVKSGINQASSRLLFSPVTFTIDLQRPVIEDPKADIMQPDFIIGSEPQ